MKITAADKFVVLKDKGNHEVGSVLVAKQVEEKNMPELGVVCEIGTGKKPFEFKIGDTVVYRKYTESPIKIAGVRYNFIKFEDLVGKIDDR